MFKKAIPDKKVKKSSKTEERKIEVSLLAKDVQQPKKVQSKESENFHKTCTKEKSIEVTSQFDDCKDLIGILNQ